MIRWKAMPPPLILKAVTTQISVTLNEETLHPKALMAQFRESE
jgi:hypothetical protein